MVATISTPTSRVGEFHLLHIHAEFYQFSCIFWDDHVLRRFFSPINLLMWWITLLIFPREKGTSLSWNKSNLVKMYKLYVASFHVLLFFRVFTSVFISGVGLYLRGEVALITFFFTKWKKMASKNKVYLDNCTIGSESNQNWRSSSHLQQIYTTALVWNSWSNDASSLKGYEC